MSITWNEASKCLKFLMRVLIIKEGDKYRPAKDTSRQDAYRALYEIQEALGTRRIEREEALLENMQDLDLAFSDLLTRGEIIGAYEDAVVESGLAAAAGNEEAAKSYELFKAGLYALRPVSRQQVEKVWRGEWMALDECSNAGVYCKRCKKKVYRIEYANEKMRSPFCPACGAAQTDEAVETVMERINEMEGMKK